MVLQVKAAQVHGNKVVILIFIYGCDYDKFAFSIIPLVNCESTFSVFLKL